jgi:ABC-type uncharacterized transport system substrate-binding protein
LLLYCVFPVWLSPIPLILVLGREAIKLGRILNLQPAAVSRSFALSAWFVVSTTPVAQITEADHSLFRVFLNELRKLGYNEGHNLIIERHSGEGRFDQFPDLARRVVQTDPEVIVAITERVAHAFKVATTTIPVVTIVSDPVAQGLARSFARPDGNITGVSGYAGFETIGKYLEIQSLRMYSIPKEANKVEEDSRMSARSRSHDATPGLG